MLIISAKIAAERMYCGVDLEVEEVELGRGGGGGAGECVDDKFQVLAWAPDRGLHITPSSSSSPLSAFHNHNIFFVGRKPEICTSY